MAKYFQQKELRKGAINNYVNGIKIPSLGWVRIKEKGYIPTTKDGYVIKSGHGKI